MQIVNIIKIIINFVPLKRHSPSCNVIMLYLVSLSHSVAEQCEEDHLQLRRVTGERKGEGEGEREGERERGRGERGEGKGERERGREGGRKEGREGGRERGRERERERGRGGTK